MKKLILSLVLLATTVLLQAQLIRVPTDFPSIQQAIDSAVNGDTVLVSPGTYHENINFSGKAITVGSFYLTTHDTSLIAQTIIDGDSVSSVATFRAGEDTTSVLCGFTLTNGFNSAGGGILIENSSPLISRCIITANHSADQGGGIYCSNSSAILENLAIKNNFCVAYGAANGYGGGGCFTDSPVRIWNSVITGNTASNGGGFCIRTSELLMDSVILEGNTAFNGGGLYCSGWPVIRNSTINGNTANKGGGIYFSGGMPKLKKVTIKSNHATEGGGLYLAEAPAYPAFDPYNLCNIYLNTAILGNDVASSNSSRQIQVVVDTFSVLRPTNVYANPRGRFSFYIKHGMIPQVMSDVYVSPSGDDGNDGLTPQTPWRTIRHAGSRIYADDLNVRIIRLLDGWYSPAITGEEFPVVLPDYTSLLGTSEDRVILDAEGSADVIRMQYNPVPMITGITITGGSAGGIVCKNSSPLLKNLVIKDNANDWGGGLKIEYSHPEIENVRIINNRATGGGGMSLIWSSAGLRNVIMQGNSGYGSCVNSFKSDLLMINTTLSGNTADSGGAVICNAGSKVKLINSLLWNGPDPEIIISPYRQGYSRDSVSIRYTGLRGGFSGIVTSDTMGVIGWFEGNLDQDPKFSGEGKDPSALKAGSPCIDTGTPDTAGLALPVIDVAGNPRIFHERIDMGAYEWNNVSIDDVRFSYDVWKVRVLPDPFSTSVTFAFSLPKACTMILDIYDGTGRRVAEFRRADSGTGEQIVTWDAATLPAGIYFYRLSAGNETRTGKLVKR